MGKSSNQFVWYDLNTTDKAGAKSFYEALVGWTIEDQDMGEAGSYTSLANGEAGFGGLNQVDGAPPCWVGYIDVDDVNARIEKLTKLGGNVIHPAFDIPGVGRIAVMADTTGGVFSLYQAAADAGDWEPSRQNPGDIGWGELATADVEKAKAFYGEGFGWTTTSMPMGDGGVYHMFMQGEQAVAGLYQKPEEMPVSAWLFYINVADIDAAVAKAKELGAQILVQEKVPGMVHFAFMMDPQGAGVGMAQDIS